MRGFQRSEGNIGVDIITVYTDELVRKRNILGDKGIKPTKPTCLVGMQYTWEPRRPLYQRQEMEGKESALGNNRQHTSLQLLLSAADTDRPQPQ